MKAFWLALPLALLLGACDNNNNDAPGPERTDEQTGTAAETAPEQEDGLAGIWQPDSDSELKALVLEPDGQLYLVGDKQYRGVNWEQNDSEDLTLHYLATDQADKLLNDNLEAELDSPALELKGDSSFAGSYRRDDSDIGLIEGKIALPADVGIPDNGVLALTLEDVSRQDSTAEVVTQRLTRLRLEGLSMPFRLYFDQNMIQPDHHYAIGARVIADGAVHFTSTTMRNVLEGEQTAVMLTLQPATNTTNSYVGHYLYYADAARFTPCGGDRRLAVGGPLAAEIEKAYLDARSEPMAPVVMQMTGDVAKRDGEEPGTTVDTLIVESYRITNERVDCSAPSAELTNTYWKLMHLADQDVPAPEDQHNQPHLILADGTIKGSTGCNVLNGQYQKDGDQLTLGKLATTRRACTGANVEQEFIAGLEKTKHFKIDGQRLSLYDGDDHLLAVLQAEYL